MININCPYTNIIIGGTNTNGKISGGVSVNTTPPRYFQGIEVERTAKLATKFTIRLVYDPETFSAGDATKIERWLNKVATTTTKSVNLDTFNKVASDAGADTSYKNGTYQSSTKYQVEAYGQICVQYGWSSSNYIAIDGLFYNYNLSIEDNKIVYTITGVGTSSVYNFGTIAFKEVTYKDCSGKISNWLQKVLDAYFKPLGYNVLVDHSDYQYSESNWQNIPAATTTLYEYLHGVGNAHIEESENVTSLVQPCNGILNMCRAKKLNSVVNLNRNVMYNQWKNMYKFSPTTKAPIPSVLPTLGELTNFNTYYANRNNAYKAKQVDRQVADGYTKDGYPFKLLIDDSTAKPLVKAIPNIPGANNGQIITFCFGNNQRNSTVKSFSVNVVGAAVMSAHNSLENPLAVTDIDSYGTEVLAIKLDGSGQNLGDWETMGVEDALQTADIAQAANYAYTAELTVRGYTGSLSMGDCINIIPLINGSKHYTAGIYTIYKIADSLDSNGTFTTTFSVYRSIAEWNKLTTSEKSNNTRYDQAINYLSTTSSENRVY